MSSDEPRRGLPSTIWSSLLTSGIWEAVGVDGLRIRGMGLNETEMSRSANTPRRADTMFSTKSQHIIGEVTVRRTCLMCVRNVVPKDRRFCRDARRYIRVEKLLHSVRYVYGFFPKNINNREAIGPA